MEGLFLLLWCLHCCWRCNLTSVKQRGMFWVWFLVIQVSDVRARWIGKKPKRNQKPSLCCCTAWHMHVLHSSRAALGQTFFLCPLQPPFNKGYSKITDLSRRISGPPLTPRAQSSAIRRPLCLLSVAKRGCLHSQGCQGIVLCQSGTSVTVHDWGWGPLHLSFCLTKWILNAGKASHESKSDPMSYLGKLKALCQFDGQRFRPEWYYWHFLPSESITAKGLQFNF